MFSDTNQCLVILLSLHLTYMFISQLRQKIRVVVAAQKNSCRKSRFSECRDMLTCLSVAQGIYVISVESETLYPSISLSRYSIRRKAAIKTSMTLHIEHHPKLYVEWSKSMLAFAKSFIIVLEDPCLVWGKSKHGSDPRSALFRQKVCMKCL